MHELLRRKASENEAILKELRKSMMNEINAKFDKAGKEQFKDVQIYLDKIKERVRACTCHFREIKT